MDDLSVASRIAAHGMKAQATRLRVISQNLANVDSVSERPGGEPYRRKTILFRDMMDRELKADTVTVRRIEEDMGPLERRYDPNHPGADEQGYVLIPNVNPLIEMMDMRESQRSYEANMQVVSVSRQMMSATLDLLK